LTTLLRNQDNLELPHDVVLRETCFFLLAGAHTSATAFVRTLDHVFTLRDTRPDDAERATHDLAYLQKCVHETIRLQPSSPVAMRWSLDRIELDDGIEIDEGDKVIIDLMAANRDPAVFGDDSDLFLPGRDLPAGAAPWGLSFGLGMHACIGQDLAAGLDTFGQEPGEDHLYGLVPVAVTAVLQEGGRRDPDDLPQLDASSVRGYWSTYPVIF
jgi:cytochrome P450